MNKLGIRPMIISSNNHVPQILPFISFLNIYLASLSNSGKDNNLFTKRSEFKLFET